MSENECCTSEYQTLTMFANIVNSNFKSIFSHPITVCMQIVQMEKQLLMNEELLNKEAKT